MLAGRKGDAGGIKKTYFSREQLKAAAVNVSSKLFYFLARLGLTGIYSPFKPNPLFTSLKIFKRLFSLSLWEYSYSQSRLAPWSRALIIHIFTILLKTASSFDYIVQNDRNIIINVGLEWIRQETLVTISGYYRVIRLEVMKKNTKNQGILNVLSEIRNVHLVNETEKLCLFSPTSQEIYHISATKTKRLMLLRERTVVHYENCTKHINIF